MHTEWCSQTSETVNDNIIFVILSLDYITNSEFQSYLNLNGSYIVLQTISLWFHDDVILTAVFAH